MLVEPPDLKSGDIGRRLDANWALWEKGKELCLHWLKESDQIFQAPFWMMHFSKGQPWIEGMA